MISKSFSLSLIACCLAVLEACHHPDPVNTTNTSQLLPVKTKATLMEPFKYHKLIESSPGEYFDVLTWGRGKDSIGGYIILHSDSTGKKYTTVTGELEGVITDVFNTDMNMDGNPEILILSKAKDTTVHVNIYAYEYRDGKGEKIDFPKLGGKSKTIYRGGDNFYIEQGNLIREFPAYDGNGKDAKPTGIKRILQYGIRDNAFTVKDITPADSTLTTTKAIVKDTLKKATATVKKQDSKPKHHVTETHHKKVRHIVKHKRKKHHRTD